MRLNETEKLIEVIQLLRKKCPWDKKQTHTSLAPYLIEEAYEAVEALHSGSSDGLQEELGDVLLQVILHSILASEKKRFDFEAVAKSLKEKMISRHPQIFGDKKGVKIKTAEDQKQNWMKIKKMGEGSLFEKVPKILPALKLSQKYGEIAALDGFDWPGVEETLEKVDEEVAELKEELSKKRLDKRKVELELGDLLYVLSRLASKLSLDAEEALRKAAQKFKLRYEAMGKELEKENKRLKDCDLDELEKTWQKVKKKVKIK